jgi:excisionase family DNA binding protein
MSKKLTVIEMANYLGVSKEAIYNRLRRGSLQSVAEDGKKYVLLTDDMKKTSRITKKRAPNMELNHEYIDLLKSQIEELKSQNKKLENDKENLIKEKEILLIESKEKIENIYKSRDEHIKAILTLANMPSLDNKVNISKVEEIEEVDIEEEIDIVDKICESYEDWVELGEFLKNKGFSKEERTSVTQKVEQMVGKNKHIKKSSGELFIKKNKKLKNIIGKL